MDPDPDPDPQHSSSGKSGRVAEIAMVMDALKKRCRKACSSGDCWHRFGDGSSDRGGD
jgi:hypothetical protein